MLQGNGMSRYQGLAAFLISFLILAVSVQRDLPRYPVADELGYLTIGYQLYRTGVFGDGSFSGNADPDDMPAPGRFFAPLYPAFLAGVMGLDSGFAETSRCILEHRRGNLPDECEADYGVLMPLQALFGAVALFSVWMAGRLVAGPARPEVAWLAMLLAALADGFREPYAMFLTEALYFPLIIWGTLALAVWAKGGRWRVALAAGLLLGLAALARPTGIYVIAAVLVTVTIMTVAGARPLFKERAIQLVVFVVSAGSVLLPWMLRNQIQFGDMALTAGYGPFILAQRVAYNLMTWQEWAISWVYWFPDIGDNLAQKLFAAEDYIRLSFDDSNSYYLVGNTVVVQKVRAVVEIGGSGVGYLVREWILNDLVKHIAVTFALLWRGIFVDKWWGVIGVFLALPVAVRMVRTRQTPFLVLFAVPLFLAGFAAFVSVSIPRYNLALVPVLSLGAALQLINWGDWMCRRLSSREGIHD